MMNIEPDGRPNDGQAVFFCPRRTCYNDEDKVVRLE